MNRFIAYMLLNMLIASIVMADPTLLFREDWAETPWALPITQEHVANPALELYLYGGAVDFLKKSHHDNIVNDPFYVWSGEIRESDVWGATLGFKDGTAVDLSGDASLTWRTRQSGDHSMRIILRTLGGSWLVSEAVDPATPDWQITTHIFSNLSWKTLDADRIDFINAVDFPEPNGIDDANAVELPEPDLTKIVEVGFTDMKAGAGSPQSSRVDWMEVWGYARPAPCAFAALEGSNLLCQTNAAFSHDGLIGTRWFSEGDNQWLRAELEMESLIQTIDIAWWKNRERSAVFEIEVSIDGRNWKTALPLTTSASLVRDYETYELPVEIQAKFVRIVGHGNSVNSFTAIREWCVLGESVSSE
jgi:hypothetical protein